MKKTKFILIAAAFAAIACTKDVQPENNVQTPDADLVPMTFVGTGETETKAAFTEITNDKRGIVWTGTDQKTDDISVLWDGGSEKFSTKESGETATFEGFSADVETFYAVYPHHESGLSLTAENIIAGVNFKAEQTAVAGSFDPTAFLAVAKTTKADKAFNFMNISAFVSFTLSDATGVEYVTFSGNNGENIAGIATISLDANYIPSVKSMTTSHKVITLTPAEGEKFEDNTEYFISLRPVTFSKGFSIAVHYTDGTSKTIKSSYIEKDIKSYRNTIKNAGLVDKREDFKAELPNNYVAYLHGYDIDIAGETFNKATYGEAALISASTENINKVVNFVNSDATITLQTKNYDNLILIGNNPNIKTNVSVKGNVRWNSNATFALKNLSISDDTANQTLFQSHSENGNVLVDGCKLPATQNTQMFYFGQDVTTFKAVNCDIEVSKAGKNLINCGTNIVTISSCTLENNIIYSPDDISSYKILGGTKITVQNLAISHNTIANIYSSTTSNAEYCQSLSVANYTCDNNLFYLPNYGTYEASGNRYSYVINVAPSTIESADNNILYREDNTNKRLRYDSTNYITSTNVAANVVTTVNLGNGIIIPAGVNGATR